MRFTQGCVGRCDFCPSWMQTSKRYLRRSVESMIAEMKTIDEPYIYFVCEESLLDTRLSLELAGAIRLTGGAARSEVWGQIFADVFQAPVEIPSGTELGALGAAICASVAAGCHPGYAEACRAMVKIARRQEPDPANRDVYATKYDRYRSVLAALEPVWKGLG